MPLRYLTLLLLLAGSFRLTGQTMGAGKKRSSGKQQQLSTVEKQAYWVKKGDDLMNRQQNYTAAYSAYLLAKSLGATGMSDKMQLAQQRNIEKLRVNAAGLAFQAGLQQARNMADTNLTQSLRLLEFLRNTYARNRSVQNETAVLKAISEVLAGSGKPLYQAKSSRLAVDSDYISEKDTLHSDPLPPSLQQPTDSVFSQLPIPDYAPKPGFMYPPMAGKLQQRGYYYSAAHQLLFTFYACLYYENESQTALDSSFSTILWRTDGHRLTPLHTFANKFARLPLLSPDGQMLAAQVWVSWLGSSTRMNRLYAIQADNQVEQLNEFPAEMYAGAPFALFSPDSRYVITHNSSSNGMTVIWRKVKTNLYYVLSVNAYAKSVRIKDQTVTMELFDLAAANTHVLTTLTIDMETQQAIVPAACPYGSNATNVSFTGDHYLLAQPTDYPPRLDAYSVQDGWLTATTSFRGEFAGGAITTNGRYAALRPQDTHQPAELWIADRPGHFAQQKNLSPGVENVLFSPDSQLALLSYGGKAPGQLVRLDGTDLRPIHTFTHPIGVANCQFSPDGRWLFADIWDTDQDSLYQITPNGLLPAQGILANGGTITVRFQPDSREMFASTMENIVQYYYKLEPGAVEITAAYNDQLPTIKTIYINGDQIFHSEIDTYAADRTRKEKEGDRLISTKLSNGTLISPVLDDGETLFFVVESYLFRQKTLVGYDKKLQQPVVSREVTGAFDLRMTADKSIQYADSSGLYTIVPPRKVLRLLQTSTVAALADKLREQFSPLKP